MFDNLREISDESAEFEEPVESIYDYDTKPQKSEQSRFLGMTTGQRFIISLMLLATVIVLGVSCLMVLGKIWIF